MEGSNESITENYLLLNASVNYILNDYIELFLSGKNLLDQEYQIDYGYPMPGINFMGGIGVKF
jgi:iron complex outermembrane receptor protein